MFINKIIRTHQKCSELYVTTNLFLRNPVYICVTETKLDRYKPAFSTGHTQVVQYFEAYKVTIFSITNISTVLVYILYPRVMKAVIQLGTLAHALKSQYREPIAEAATIFFLNYTYYLLQVNNTSISNFVQKIARRLKSRNETIFIIRRLYYSRDYKRGYKIGR